MYNIRQKLSIIMVVLFIAAIPVSLFTKKHDPNASVMASSDSGNAQQEVESFWGDNPERFVAHRGYSGYAPENSIPAYELAGRMGFWGIETDISETSDGYFVCMHDEDLDRMTDGEGTIGGYTFEQIQQYSIDSGNYLSTTENRKIPTLGEYLDICRAYGCIAVVEIKKIQSYDSFLNEISEHGMINRCLIISGSIEDLQAVRAINSQLIVMQIGYYPAPYSSVLSSVADISDNRGALYNYPQIEDGVIEMLHSQDVLCAAWTVDDGEVAKKFIDNGIDFLVTNEIPARLTSMINENE